MATSSPTRPLAKSGNNITPCGGGRRVPWPTKLGAPPWCWPGWEFPPRGLPLLHGDAWVLSRGLWSQAPSSSLVEDVGCLHAAREGDRPPPRLSRGAQVAAGPDVLCAGWPQGSRCRLEGVLPGCASRPWASVGLYHLCRWFRAARYIHLQSGVGAGGEAEGNERNAMNSLLCLIPQVLPRLASPLRVSHSSYL